MMKSLGMGEKYKFDVETIDSKVTRKSPGNYALCNENKLCYVGRSDDHVKERLKDEIVEKPNLYTHFKFSYANSSKEAFEKECKNCHDFHPPDNDIHPASPKNTNLRCPECGKRIDSNQGDFTIRQY